MNSDVVSVDAGSEALSVLRHANMRCGGCGAKVGSSVLSRVLSRLRADVSLELEGCRKEEVLVGLDSPDDCAVVKPPPEGKVYCSCFELTIPQ